MTNETGGGPGEATNDNQPQAADDNRPQAANGQPSQGIEDKLAGSPEVGMGDDGEPPADDLGADDGDPPEGDLEDDDGSAAPPTKNSSTPVPLPRLLISDWRNRRSRPRPECDGKSGLYLSACTQAQLPEMTTDASGASSRILPVKRTDQESVTECVINLERGPATSRPVGSGLGVDRSSCSPDG